VGYSGGTSPDPTYHNIGDHMESIQIRYDPDRVSYEEILKVFWDEHDHTGQPWSRQYMNAAFFHSKEQKEMIITSMALLPGKVRTEVIPYSEFFEAEDYHQKFYLQRHAGIKQEYMEIYPVFQDFVRSAAVARVNGMLGGYGSGPLFEKNAPGLGLSQKSEAYLRTRLFKRDPGE